MLSFKPFRMKTRPRDTALIAPILQRHAMIRSGIAIFLTPFRERGFLCSPLKRRKLALGLPSTNSPAAAKRAVPAGSYSNNPALPIKLTVHAQTKVCAFYV
jgi:hypothetical protein